MKKHALISLTILIGAFFLASSAYALPTLLTDEVTKMKFTNYENLIDIDESGSITAGDKFFGIITLTTISDVDSTGDSVTWTNAGEDEITGIFTLTVDSVQTTDGSGELPSNLVLGTTESAFLTFTMEDGDGITMYYDDGTGIDFIAQGDILTSIASATDGVVWISISSEDYLDGYNVTNYSTSSNFNWVDITENNTGYNIISMIWKDTLGSVNPYASIESDLYFETKLEFLTSTDYEWAYKSEDPVYLYATAIPEPNTMILFGIGLLSFAGIIRRKP